ncbi:MAG: PorV/PorQ family protein [Gemmatimonadetes bacterium]|nr:PorV/PorQ family protein [Gemmatimonadota bacterium]NNM03964.1 PorV/PorQ family protein [Gemmatimonadota bacterium]
MRGLPRKELWTAPVLGLVLVLLRAGSVDAQKPYDEKSTAGLGAYAAGIFTAQPSSTEGALTLLLPIGARGIGMGRAVTATAGRESVFWNPAGLARLEEGSFSVYRGNHLAGEATGFSLILARQPLGALAISYQLLDLGDQDLRDIDGTVLGSVSFRDHLAVVSFGLQILPRMDTGLNFKVFQSRITCRGQCTDAGVTGTTYALDAGIQGEPLPDIPLRVGILVAHVGPSLQLINAQQADPLPSRLRAAVAYEALRHFTEREGVELWVSAEMEDRWRDLGDPILYLGAEFSAGEEDLFFLRAGYGQQQSGQTAGASVGLGLRYERFELAIAKRVSGSSLTGESEPVHISFGVVF